MTLNSTKDFSNMTFAHSVTIPNKKQKMFDKIKIIVTTVDGEIIPVENVKC